MVGAPFGASFYEAFRLTGQEGDIPWTLDSMERAHYLYAGTADI